MPYEYIKYQAWYETTPEKKLDIEAMCKWGAARKARKILISMGIMHREDKPQSVVVVEN